MKKILFLLSVVLFCNLSYSQFVTITTNLQGSNLGRVNTDKYFSTQGIYTKTEIGDANFTTQELAINKVSIRVKDAFTATINDSFKIWMRDIGSDTTKFTRAGGVQYKYSSAGFTLVYKGSISLADTGWKEILLQTPFKRTAGKNLLVMVERLDGLTVSQGQLWSSTGSGSNLADSSCRRYQGTTAPVVNTNLLSPTVYRLAMQFIHQLPTDAGVIGIANPVVSCYGSNQTVKVKVKNYGLNNIASGAASVTLKVRGANSYVGTLTNNAAIASGDTAILNFSDLNLNNEGLNYDTAIVSLANDGSSDNDKFTSTISTAGTIYNLPAIEDFDLTTSLFSFKAIEKGRNQLWSSQNGTYTNPGPQSISPRDTGVNYYLMEGYNQPNGSSGWISRLYSNCIVLPGTSLSVPTRSAKVSFWMSHDNFTSAGADSMYVTVSTDKGATWTRVQGFARYSSTAGSTASWKKDSVDISQYVGQTVQIGFDAIRQFGSFGLDDITVTTDPLPPPICVNPPTAYAGVNTTICSVSNYNLDNASPTYGGSATIAVWSTSGTGSFTGGSDFDNATEYSPSAADIQAGSVQISLITNNPAGGVCVSDTSTFTLTIDKGSFNSTSITNCESYNWHNNTYTESGDYTFDYNNSNGCPSTDTLHLTITNGDFTTTTQSACGSYLWSSNNQTYTTSGNYINTYSNNSGCVSADTLHLTITTPSFTSTTDVGCDSYVWELNGQTYTNSGTYIYSSGVGCLSADTLHLTINNSTHNVISVTNCESYTWSANGQTYTASGNYVYTYLNGSNCASADTLHLTITKGTHNVSSITNCESYTWSTNGQTYTASGNYVYTYTNGSNCASADTLHLTITNGTHNATSITNCESYTWSANGQTYTASGDYIYTYTNGFNCASADTLHLTITKGTHNVISVTNCESYTWSTNGQTYTASGNYVYTYTNGSNCASADTLHLTITKGTHNVSSITNCESYTWSTNGQTYTASGDYVYTYTNGSNCASADTLHLTIATGSFNASTITNCDSYTWSANGQTYTESGDYVYNYNIGSNCASADTLHLTITKGTHNATSVTNCESYTWSTNGQTYTASGTYVYTYTNGSNCASADTLHLTITNGTHNATTISSCNSYTWLANSQTYTESGDYIYTYTNGSNCASADTLHLTITTGTFNASTITNCDSYSWSANGQTYTESGDYIYTYNNGSNCASADTLHLTITNSTHNVSSITNCESYTWSANGQTYTESGTYVYDYTNESNCPSADTLHLTITNGTHNATTISSCNSYTWSTNEQTYTESGDYVYTYTNGLNCASADTLHLTITTGTFNASSITNCDSYTWSANGQTYTESGDYIYTYNNGSNCASADTLHLTITHSTTSDTTAFACGSFEWYGNTYYASGNPTRILTNANNCDSVITLHLTIGNANTGDTTALACESFDWYGNTYTTSGTHTQIFTNASGCDSVVTLHLTIGYSSSNDTTVVACGSYTWNGNTFNSSTDTTVSFTTATGCDSSLTLHLTINAIPSVSSINGPDTVEVLSSITLTNSTADGIWSSADENIATVDQQGSVLGLTVGDVQISYTVTDAITGCFNSASHPVNVNSSSLPVSLINFSARLMDKNHALVSWNVNNEIKLNHYEVERSFDGVSFMNRNNKSVSGSATYSYLDELNTTASTVYYRIKMVNNDGTFNYSNVIMVRIAEMNIASVVYPNPFTNSITIEYNSLVEEKVMINLMSTEGKKLQQKIVSVHAGSNKINLDRLNILPNGTYMLEIVNSANKVIKQIMKR